MCIRESAPKGGEGRARSLFSSISNIVCAARHGVRLSVVIFQMRSIRILGSSSWMGCWIRSLLSAIVQASSSRNT